MTGRTRFQGFCGGTDSDGTPCQRWVVTWNWDQPRCPYHDPQKIYERARRKDPSLRDEQYDVYAAEAEVLEDFEVPYLFSRKYLSDARRFVAAVLDSEYVRLRFPALPRRPSGEADITVYTVTGNTSYGGPTCIWLAHLDHLTILHEVAHTLTHWRALDACDTDHGIGFRTTLVELISLFICPEMAVALVDAYARYDLLVDSTWERTALSGFATPGATS